MFVSTAISRMAPLMTEPIQRGWFSSDRPLLRTSRKKTEKIDPNTSKRRFLLKTAAPRKAAE